MDNVRNLMRILYFSEAYTPHDHRFLTALGRTEHQVFYLRRVRNGISETRGLPERIKEARILAEPPIPFGNLATSVKRFCETVDALKPDLVHAGPITGPAWISSLGGFRPLVSMSWGSDLLHEARRGWRRWRAKFVLSHSAVVLVDSVAGEEKAISLGTTPSRVIRFPWGVDLDQFQAAADRRLRDELGWGENLVIISTRAWESIYGVEIALRGFLLAAKRDPRMRLMLLGSGSEVQRIEGLVQASGMADRVWRPGRIAYEDLPRFYQAADLYLSASYSDGSSVSLLEAMATGLPAIVTDIPGNLEWVSSGETGWRFQAGDPEDLAAALLEAAKPEAGLAQIGQACRRVVEEKADWSRNSQKLLEAYDLARQEGAR